MIILYTVFLLLLVPTSHPYSYSCDSNASCGCSSNPASVTRIVGGESAATNTWGWAVSLSLRGTSLCGGSVLSSSWIITAAHCRQNMEWSCCVSQSLCGTNDTDILEHHLLPQATRLFGHDWRLQQDNDPKHTSRVAKEFINKKVLELLEWPSNSPDLNPIENYWNVIKRRVEKRKPGNIDELEKYMNEDMEKPKASFLINFVSSMKDRCLAVIFSNGERINFWNMVSRSIFRGLSNGVLIFLKLLNFEVLEAKLGGQIFLQTTVCTKIDEMKRR
jgi:hypothetical protein